MTVESPAVKWLAVKLESLARRIRRTTDNINSRSRTSTTEEEQLTVFASKLQNEFQFLVNRTGPIDLNEIHKRLQDYADRNGFHLPDEPLNNTNPVYYFRDIGSYHLDETLRKMVLVPLSQKYRRVQLGSYGYYIRKANPPAPDTATTPPVISQTQFHFYLNSTGVDFYAVGPSSLFNGYEFHVGYDTDGDAAHVQCHHIVAAYCEEEDAYLCFGARETDRVIHTDDLLYSYETAPTTSTQETL